MTTCSSLVICAGCACRRLPARSAADKVKVGFVSTLSGPNAAIGVDIRDAFNLAIKLNGGKLGGLPAEVLVERRPAQARERQADRRALSAAATRSTSLPASCSPTSCSPIAPDAIAQQDVLHLAQRRPGAVHRRAVQSVLLRRVLAERGLQRGGGPVRDLARGSRTCIFLAPNYVGGQDAATGFKRYYKGKLVDEMYTKLGQLDYAAELSQIRAAKPEALYVFLPGGMGVNFIKQFVAAGMSKDIQLDRAAVGLRPGHHPRGRRPDARPLQRRPLVDRHG